MKFILLLCLMTSLFLSFPFESNAAYMPIDIEVNGLKIKTDSPPYISDGTTYVPIRFVSEALSLSCSWDEDERVAEIYDDETTIRFYPDKNIAHVNGRRKKVTSSITNNRIMVPIRFVSENYDAKVSFDSTFYRVIVESDKSVPTSLKDNSYNQDEVYWLSRIIHAEANGESVNGQIAVGNVVLNRVKSKEFPNTIYGVIFDRNGGTQFEPVINNSIYCTPSYNSVAAAKRALMGENTAGKSLFFLNPKKAQNSWIIRNKTYLKSIGNHDFYM